MKLLTRSRSENPADPPSALAQADLPAGYRPIARLAHGKRLDTWDAWDEDRDVRCVVKVLHRNRRHEERVVRATLQEGEILTSLSHPHLVRGYGVHEDPPSLVIETLRGATLSHLIDEEGPIPLADVAELGLQLVSVLSYLHRHDWLHLDVKPDNVVVDHGKAVLIDLSLAARPGDGRPGAGTRGYLAPEQAHGRGLGAATDVWGLGTTLIECFLGDIPYGDEQSWGEAPRWQLGRRRPAGPVGLEELPEPVRGLLTACVDPDQQARPRLADIKAELRPLTAR